MKAATLIAILAMTAGASLQAKDRPAFVTAKAVKDSPVVALDPAKAYLQVRTSGSVILYLMRIPDDADKIVYGRMRAEGLADAKKKYAGKLNAYLREKALYDSGSTGRGRPEEPTKPIEPTEENFEFTPFGLLANFEFGPLDRFSKPTNADKSSRYLQEVTPGSYYVYGWLSTKFVDGVIGRCFCLGSVKFDLKAGEITDLGMFSPGEATKYDKNDSSRPEKFTVNFRPGIEDMVPDARLNAMKTVSARLRPIGKTPNYFGIKIDRFPEIEGVMRYDRDRIVDLTGTK